MVKRLVLTYLLLSLISIISHSQNPVKKDYTADYARYVNPAGFVKNAGQFTDEKNEYVKEVLYGTHIGNCGIFITTRGLSYINYKIKDTNAGRAAKETRLTDSVPGHVYDIERVDITLAGASINSVNTMEVNDGKELVSYNYYTPLNKTGITGIHSCKELVFKNIYPGIDWIVQLITGKTGATSLKYNFIVQPGIDISKIKLKYSKNVKLTTTREGDLLARSILYNFTEKAPVSYTAETQMPILLNYEVKGQVVSFKGKEKSFTEKIIIDPEVFWGTYLPSLAPDKHFLSMRGADITTDINSNIFVMINNEQAIPFITVNPGNGAYYQDFASTRNAALVIMKFTKNGQLLWSTYFTGKGQTKGVVMTTGKDGDIYAVGSIVGDFWTNTVEGNSDIPLKDNGGYFDGKGKLHFITRFSNNGQLLWCSFLGGHGTNPNDITTDASGNLYLAGLDNSSNYPLVNPGNGAYMQTSKTIAAYVPFIMQFDVNNKLVWSTHMEGNDHDPLQRIEIDKKGNIYLASDMRSTKYPWLNAGGYFYTRGGFSVARFNSNRQLTWCTNIAGGSFSLGDITTDDDCNLYVASGNGILRKFNEKTELVWTKQYPFSKGFSYDRMIYNKISKVIHVFGVMNDSPYDFPTKNTDCGSSFFFSGRGGWFLSYVGPIFTTYTTDGDVQYCSLADWPMDAYSSCNFVVDNEGNQVYFFKIISVVVQGRINHTLKDPGNGAYYQPNLDNNDEKTYILKLNTLELNVTTTTSLSATCDCNNLVDIKPLCGKAPFTYQWSNGESSSTAKLCSGDYWVKVTDDNFLTRTVYGNIPKSSSDIRAFNAEVRDAHCDMKNGSIFINNIQGGTSPYTFSINQQPFTGSNTYPGIDSGSYIIAVKDAKGCIAKDTFPVGYIPGPTAIQSIITPASCSRDDAVANIHEVKGGTSPYLYSINNGPYSPGNVFRSLPASSPAISVKDAAGCTYSSNIVIPRSSPPDSVQLSVQADHCFSGVGTFTVKNIFGGAQPFNISLDNQNFTSQPGIHNLKAGTYDLYIKDNNSCILTSKVVIDNIPAPEKAIYKIQDAICGKITGAVQIDSVINGRGPFLFSLDAQNYQSSSRFANIPYGTYTLNTKDGYGCHTSEKIEIRYVKQYDIDILPHDTIVCYGQKIPLSLKLENPSYVNGVRWSTGETRNDITFSPVRNTPVFVSVTDKNGCVITDTAFTGVKACNTAEKCIAIPTAFSPNNDGYNDAIGPVANGCLVKNMLFQIYNRWGQLVFETTELGRKWDGRIRNEDQTEGTYIFKCFFTSNDNIPYSIKGTLQLVR